MSIDLPEIMSERTSRRYARKNRMSEDMQICQKECRTDSRKKDGQKESQKYFHKICQQNARKNVRRYARKNVRRYAKNTRKIVRKYVRNNVTRHVRRYGDKNAEYVSLHAWRLVRLKCHGGDHLTKIVFSVLFGPEPKKNAWSKCKLLRDHYQRLFVWIRFSTRSWSKTQFHQHAWLPKYVVYLISNHSTLTG